MENFEVLTDGNILEGFKREEVIENLRIILKDRADNAEGLLGGKVRSLKKNLSQKSAEELVEKYRQLGVNAFFQQMVDVEKQSVSSIPASSFTLAIVEDDIETEIESAADHQPDNLSLSNAAPTYSTASNIASKNSHSRAFACPKCGKEQTKSKSCISCGIFFEKFLEIQERKAAIEEGGDPETEQSVKLETGTGDGFPILGLAAAAIGVAIWIFIAFFVGLEFGLIASLLLAWAIGAWTVKSNPAGGTTLGLIAALVALVAILSGKYVIYQIQDHRLSEDAEWRAELSEELLDMSDDEWAEQYALSGIVDGFLKGNEPDISRMSEEAMEQAEQEWANMSYDEKEKFKQDLVRGMNEGISTITELFFPKTFRQSVGWFDRIVLLISMCIAYLTAARGRY